MVDVLGSWAWAIAVIGGPILLGAGLYYGIHHTRRREKFRGTGGSGKEDAGHFPGENAGRER